MEGSRIGSLNRYTVSWISQLRYGIWAIDEKVHPVYVSCRVESRRFNLGWRWGLGFFELNWLLTHLPREPIHEQIALYITGLSWPESKLEFNRGRSSLFNRHAN